MPPEENTLAQTVADTTPPVITTPVEIDPDDAEVEAARAAVEKPAEAEPPKTEAKPTVTATTPTAAPSEPAAEPADEEDKAQQAMMPVWRANERVQKEREANARLAGENEALKLMLQQRQPANPAATPQPKTAEEQLKDIRAERRAIAEKFDNGEINRAQEAEALEALNDREYAIREEQWKAKSAPQPKAEPAAEPADDMYLDGLTVKLADDHPFVDHLRQDQVDFLVAEATRQLASEGVQFAKGNLPSAQRYVLRERVAVLSDAYGPAMTGKTLEQVKGKTTTTTTTQPGKPPALSHNAQARSDKLELARNAPPNLSNISGTPSSTEPTEDDILGMSEEEILIKVPKATREKLMGLA